MELPLTSTDKIILNETHCTPDELGVYFPIAFDVVRGQILKLERFQEYREPGKSYDEALSRGDVKEALKYIPDIIDSNKDGYKLLKSRNVEFIRCRPITIPPTPYTKWEIAVFRETSKAYEDIYWCLYSQLDLVFDKYARHDFMIFDARMAIIQNYNESGLLVGGWFIDKPEKIIQLITLFGYIKANCLSIDLLQSPKIEIQ